MGWTYMNRPKGVSDRQWLDGEFDSASRRIVAMSSTRTLMHVVVEMDAGRETSLVPDEHGKVRLCMVLLTKWIRGDYHNFGYKDMSEFSGPCEASCPAKLLDMLSPLKPELVAAAQARRDAPDGYSPILSALEWRERCRTVAANRKSLTIGGTYRLPYKINFNYYGEVDTFTLIERKGRRAIFRPLMGAQVGGRVRLRQENLNHLRAV